MNNFQFHSGEPLVLDGGLGTQLEKKGCDVSSRLWSARVLLDRPDMVEQVHSEYLEAGADCITTASYQVSFEGFSKAALSRKQTVKALQESVHLAQTSRQKFLLKHPRSRLPIIAASVGPYGASLGDGCWRRALHSSVRTGHSLTCGQRERVGAWSARGPYTAHGSA